MKNLNLIAFSLVLLSATLVSGCASMNEKECLSADWKLVGFEDGSRGKPQAVIGNYRKDCAKVNVVPDLARYQQGHAEGARTYCVKSTAYSTGVNGGAYNGICPADLEPAFLRAYSDGQALYAISRDIKALETSLQSHQADIADIEKTIKDREQAIVDSKSTSKERREHLAEIKKLHEDLASAQALVESDTALLSQRQYDYQLLAEQHKRKGY